MKKISTAKTIEDDDMSDELLPEYEFDYSKARPNRFAERVAEGSVAIVLDPDVAEVFKTPEAVNRVLRALIATMPEPTKPTN
jgi:hypothetical protein